MKHLDSCNLQQVNFPRFQQFKTGKMKIITKDLDYE